MLQLLTFLQSNTLRPRHTDRGKVPDGDGARLAAHDERAAILQQLDRTNVVIALLVT